MPILAALLANAFGGVVAFLASFVGKKIAVGTAYAAFLAAGWIAVQAAIFAAWSALAFAVPASMLPILSVSLYILPSNTFACVGVIVAVTIARWLWDRQREWAAAVAAA